MAGCKHNNLWPCPACDVGQSQKVINHLRARLAESEANRARRWLIRVVALRDLLWSPEPHSVVCRWVGALNKPGAAYDTEYCAACGALDDTEAAGRVFVEAVKTEAVQETEEQLKAEVRELVAGLLSWGPNDAAGPEDAEQEYFSRLRPLEDWLDIKQPGDDSDEGTP